MCTCNHHHRRRQEENDDWDDEDGARVFYQHGERESEPWNGRCKGSGTHTPNAIGNSRKRRRRCCFFFFQPVSQPAIQHTWNEWQSLPYWLTKYNIAKHLRRRRLKGEARRFSLFRFFYNLTLFQFTQKPSNLLLVVMMAESQPFSDVKRRRGRGNM